MTATAVFAMQMSSPEFRKDLDAALTELASLRAAAKAKPEACDAESRRTFEQFLLSASLYFSRLSVVPDVDSLDKEQDILGDVCGMVGDAFQVVRNKH